MATCSNCKKSLSCGCQKRKASNGTSVCASCITIYESKLDKPTIVSKPKPKIIAANPNVWGANRYKK
jgi:hypothetical protein